MYNRIFTCLSQKKKDEETILDHIFMVFNIPEYMPRDFTGHSLSVSDIIGLRKGALMEYYYVDSIGFALLEGFGKRFVTEIVWDTDDDDLTEEEKFEAREMLPSRVAVAEDADIEEITESLETEYGLLVNGFVLEPEEQKKETA